MQVVFSVEGEGNKSQGAATLLRYGTTHAAQGGGWNGSTAFDVPIDGIYLFTITFVKDPLTDEGYGTKDDVFINLVKNGNVPLSNAWAGQGLGDERKTAAMTAAFPLKKGDRIETYVDSDQGRPRIIRQYQWTGLLAASLG